MALQLANRISRLPPQFFAALVAEAASRQRAGQSIINLGQGNPVDPTPPAIVEALAAAAADPRHHQYGSFRGLDAFKAAGSRWWRRRYGVELDPEREIAVVIGVKVALAELTLLTANEGDGVLVPDPGYPDYDAGIALAGARRLPYVLGRDRGYQPDFDALPTARLMFLNYPHNPTGALAGQGTLAAAVAWARRTGALLVQDLAYGDIVFDGQRARSLLAEPGGRDVGVELLSLSKTFHMAGWRIGLVAGGADIIRELERLQDHLHCSQFGAIQAAAALGLDEGETIAAETAAIYQRRRDLFTGALAAAGHDIPLPAGGIFLWWPVPGGGSGTQFARFLLDHAGVLVAPGAGFGREGIQAVRLSLTTPEGALADAAQRIIAALDDWDPSQEPA